MSKLSNSQVVADQVNLVDEQGLVCGHMDKIEAHRGEGKKHQAISLFFFRVLPNKKIELLLQKRSSVKIVAANQWANSLCANLLPKETHRACLKRRLKEELGIEEKKWAQSAQKLFDFSYQVACENDFSENELDRFFLSICDAGQEPTLAPQSVEVSAVAWKTWSLENPTKLEQKDNFAPWFSLFLNNKTITKRIDQQLKNFLAKKETI